MGTKVSMEMAVQDFDRWISIKQIREQKRQENAKSKFEDIITTSICEGDLAISEDGYITHKLIFPLKDGEGGELLNELKFMPRIPVKLLSIKLKGVDPSDMFKMQIAYISALTNVNMGIIEKLETEDFRICQSIVMYFL